jgi:deoxyribonuclease IV
MSLIGIHIGNILNIPEYIESEVIFDKINLVQTFLSATTNYSDNKFSGVLNYLKTNKIYLVIHASYSINLSRRWSDNDWWIQQFIGEIFNAGIVNAFGIIIHTGKRLELSNAEAINNMYSALLHVHGKTLSHQKVKILIETPSGQGTETLINIEEFCKFMNKFYKHPDKNIRDRFGVCIDTCHVFAAGNEIRTEESMNSFFKKIDTIIGTDKIKLCHVNDSKKGLGSKLDRHEIIGKGELGLKPIIKIVKFMKSLQIPIILETPTKGLINDYKLLTNK